MELTWEFMNNPAQITIMPEQKTVDQVVQTLYHVGREDKFRLLLGLLRQEGGERILIFSNTREEARRLEDRLTRNGWEARALTGDVEQKRRLRILNDFKEGKLPVLVASDVASRGLHIEAVSHVVNWDLPQDPEDYVHRIGRTARAGAEGKAISLVDETSALNLEAIEKFLGHKISVEWPEDDLFMDEIKPTTEERRRYAEERRARLDARARRDGRERGGGRPRRAARARRERPLRPEASVGFAQGRAAPGRRRRERSRGVARRRGAPGSARGPVPRRDAEPRVRFETVTVGDALGPVAAARAARRPAAPARPSAPRRGAGDAPARAPPDALPRIEAPPTCRGARRGAVAREPADLGPDVARAPPLAERGPEAMTLTLPKLLPTSVVGSHGLPGWVWLAREAMEQGRLGALDVRELLEDATQVAILDQERAGVDVLTTGEMGRVRFIIGFYDSIKGIRALPAPRQLGQPLWDTNTPFEVVEKISAPHGLGIVDEFKLARALTDRPLKATVPGPYTLLVPLKLGGGVPRQGHAARRSGGAS